MEDEQTTFFHRFYKCLHSSLTPKNVSNCCKGERSFIRKLWDGDPWGPPCGGPTKCPHYNPKPNKCDDEPVCDDDKDPEDQENCVERDPCPFEPIPCPQPPLPRRQYIQPEEPPDKSCCYIQEQNPLKACCCELRDPDDDGYPCPPAGYSQDIRTPSCGCDFCRKSGYHGRCCGRSTYVSGTVDDPPTLEHC